MVGTILLGHLPLQYHYAQLCLTRRGVNHMDMFPSFSPILRPFINLFIFPLPLSTNPFSWNTSYISSECLDASHIVIQREKGLVCGETELA